MKVIKTPNFELVYTHKLSDLPKFDPNLPVFCDIETNGLYIQDTTRLVQYYQPETDPRVWVLDVEYFGKALIPMYRAMGKPIDDIVTPGKLAEFHKPLWLVFWNGVFDQSTLSSKAGKAPTQLKSHKTILSDKVDDLWYMAKVALPKLGKYNLDVVVNYLLGNQHYEDLIKKDLQKKGFKPGPLTDEQLIYSATDVYVMAELWDILYDKVKDNLAYKISIKNQWYSVRWQQTGLKVNLGKLLEEEKKLLVELDNVSKKLPESLNVNSPKQVTAFLKVPKSDEDTLLHKAAEGCPYSKNILEKRAILKTLKFIDTYRSDRVYSFYNPMGTKTGRWSCILKGTKVSTISGDTPIEEVKPGTLVYTYSDDGKVELKPVLRVFDQGIRKVVKLIYRDIGSQKKGTLVCTPDHLLRTIEGKWVPAGRSKGIRVSYLLRRKQKRSNREGEDWVIKGNGYNIPLRGVKETSIIKEYLGIPSKIHAHHKDRNPLNNNIDNLEFISAEDHALEHWEEVLGSYSRDGESRKGSDNPMWRGGASEYSMFRSFVITKSSKLAAKRLGLSHKTFKRRWASSNLPSMDYISRKIRVRTDDNGKIIPRNKIIKAYYNILTYKDILTYLGKTPPSRSYHRYVERLFKHAGIENNHVIELVLPIGEGHVYDLEIEGNHNFIANEICVHNCKSAKVRGTGNLQQLPRKLKHIFGYTDEEPYVMVGADLPTAELRLAAAIYEDMVMYKAFKEDIDLHILTASRLTGKSMGDITSSERKIAKAFNFGLLFGMKADKFRSYAFTSYGLVLTQEEAEEGRNKWMDTYHGIKETIEKVTRQFYRNKDMVVYTPMGLPVKPDLYTDALNIPVQGAVAEIAKLWIHYTWQEHNKGISDHAKQVLPIENFVHDSLTLGVPEDEADYWKELIAFTQQKAWSEYCKLPMIKIKDIPMIAEVGVSKSYQGAS